MYTVEFEVEGSFDFPTDMLRYDSCWPRSSEDAIAIAASLGRWETDDPQKMRKVTLITVSKYKNQGKPTIGRWQSFGWRVNKVSTPRKV